MLPVNTLVLGYLIVVLALAGAVNGVAGFGFAVLGTLLLATVVDPAVAVVVMILPMVAVNATLTRELSKAELRTCTLRFWPFILSALVATLVGMLLLDRVPDAPLRILLGGIALVFVATAQEVVRIPGYVGLKQRCFIESPSAMVGIGGLSGLVFGATNVGVQMVAYVRSLELSHRVFIGVVALIFVGINLIRVGAAAVFGLYPTASWLVISLGGVVPAVMGVAAGRQARSMIPAWLRDRAVLVLLALIGIRLLLDGFGLA